MNKLFKRTKILATVGPSVFAEAKIKAMVYAGVNGFRINFSHGNNAEREEQIKLIRKYADERGKSVAILQDLQGPKIRLGAIQNNHMDIKAGDELILDYALKTHDGSNMLPVQYNLANKVQVGEAVYLFDGKIQTKVEEIVSPDAIRVKALNDGFIMSNKGINLPNTDMGGDVVTDKDITDIEFGAKHDFDFVAMSFVQTAEDVERVRQLMLANSSRAQLIAKIETKKAVESLEAMEAIVQAADGIMIARGDMAIEVGAEVVPIVQRQLIKLCRKYSKICIVATQMMASMVDNPQPTRAEVSDVATAVLLGADAVMLSDETANGAYPIESIEAMKKVILYTQEHSEIMPMQEEPRGDFRNYDIMAKAAVGIAEAIKADFIVTATKTGATAAAVAAQRPNVPIISITNDARVAGQLALNYADSSFVRPYTDTAAMDAVIELKQSGYLKLAEDKSELTMVMLSSSQRDKVGSTDSILIRKV